MRIALDFDGTYDVDPELWKGFIRLARSRGHKVFVVTMRYKNSDEENDVRAELGHLVDGIFCTSRQAKKPYMEAQGVNINVWIDDNPNWILTNARG